MTTQIKSTDPVVFLYKVADSGICSSNIFISGVYRNKRSFHALNKHDAFEDLKTFSAQGLIKRLKKELAQLKRKNPKAAKSAKVFVYSTELEANKENLHISEVCLNVKEFVEKRKNRYALVSYDVALLVKTLQECLDKLAGSKKTNDSDKIFSGPIKVGKRYIENKTGSEFKLLKIRGQQIQFESKSAIMTLTIKKNKSVEDFFRQNYSLESK